MSSEADDFNLEELQEIKSQIEQYGMDLKYFKPAELSTTEVCKDIGCFNVEAWLSEDPLAGHSFKKKLGASKGLHYIAGMLQWGKVYSMETSYRGLYYMLSKVFIAQTPLGEHSQVVWPLF